ncbi:MAG: aldo/keto reductase [Kiritimatiellia bacterium]|nr:aldo/keto reductase [Kiritimatiellia bacterium]
MKTRKLGTTGIELTVIGLGTWAHGGGGWAFSWGKQDDNESIATIKAAVETGINWVDTAAVYGLGHSEKVLGRALKKLKQKPFVATKCGRTWDSTGNVGNNLRAKSIRAECEASLRRLQLDVIDLYQIHWSNPDEQIEEGWTTIAGLIKEGKVRYGGVSNFSAAQLKRIMPIHPVASLQPPYSMLKRNIETDLLDFCSKNKIGVICYSPLQKGLLTGKITADYIVKMGKDDHRRRDPMFNEPAFSVITKKIEALTKIAAKNKITPAQLAIAWILRRPEMTAAIVGARRPDQIKQTDPAADVVFSSDDLAQIEKIIAE